MFEERTGPRTSKFRDKLAKAWIVFLVTTICLTLVSEAIYATRLPAEQYERARWVGHTREVITHLATLALHVTDSEADQQGFLLTGNPDRLASFNTSVRQVSNDLDKLTLLIADNEIQRDRLSQLRKSINQKVAESIAATARHKAKSGITNRPAKASDGEDQLQLIRQQIDNLWKEEQKLLQARMISWQHTASRANSAVFTSAVIILMLLVVTGLSLWRLANQRRKLTESERLMGNMQRAKAERLMEIVTIQREIAGHSLDLDVAMQAMTEHTRRLTDAEGSIVETLEDEHMVYRAASGVAARHVGMRLKAEGSLSGMSVLQDAVLRCDDSETDDRVDRVACRAVGLRSMIVVPLLHKEQKLGVLKVLSSRVAAFNDDDVATLELLAGVLSGVFRDAIATNTLRKLNVELVDANVTLETLATTDGMTGLKNHRVFQETLTYEHQRARRSERPLSLLLLDVDYFKKFNDAFGHPAGDTVLKRVAKLIQGRTRVTDHVARYGGEEFAVLLPDTDAQGASIIAEGIREAIAGDEWPLRSVTVSVGVSTLRPDFQSEADLVLAADQALYQSKHNGRNRVSHYEPFNQLVVAHNPPIPVALKAELSNR